MRLGNYEKTVLRGIYRQGNVPRSIQFGYSRQVRSLRKKGIIRVSNNKLYATKKGLGLRDKV